MNGVRMDKWLWAARFYKTRSLAARACELGRVECNGQPTKPSREVHVGEMLRVRTDAAEFQVKVLGLSETRGPAPVAQTLYAETDESKELRQRVAEARKAAGNIGGWHEERPSKRDRRSLERLRNRL
jgi:ribosome-associated heat shock protein Hsp15